MFCAEQHTLSGGLYAGRPGRVKAAVREVATNPGPRLDLPAGENNGAGAPEVWEFLA